MAGPVAGTVTPLQPAAGKPSAPHWPVSTRCLQGRRLTPPQRRMGGCDDIDVRAREASVAPGPGLR